MSTNVIRTLSHYARNFVSKPTNPNESIVSLAASTCSFGKLRHYSSEVDSPRELEPASTQDEAASSDVEDVSEEELKRRIQKFYDGDEDAIPSILEGILQRKLTGKNDEDLIEQLPCRVVTADEVSESDEDID